MIENKNTGYEVCLINYFNDNLIPGCLDAILKQKTLPHVIYIIDNSNTLKYQWEKSININIHQYQPEKNLGYSGAVNYALSHCSHEYLLVLNPDVLLTTTYCEILFNYMNNHDEIGSAGGLLLRYDFTKQTRTTTIDSTGISMTSSGKFTDRGQGYTWVNQYTTGYVFGISGAAVMYRTLALYSIAIDGKVFDEDMFAYKEDIDVAWRLNQGKWRNIFVAEALGFHGRAAGLGHGSLCSKIRRHRSLNLRVRQLSFKNQILLLIKNANRKDLSWLQTLMRTLSFFVYTLFFETKVLLVLGELLRQWPQAWASRQKKRHCGLF